MSMSRSMPHVNDVLVVGDGVVGSSAAYHLACAGRAVTLVDRAGAGQATAAGAGIIAPATSFASPPAFFPLASRAVAFYPDLLASLAEDGETDTGYEVVGALIVATNDEEAARLPTLARLLDERRAAGMPNVGTIDQVSAAEAKDLFPALAAVRGGIHVSGAARVDGRLLRAALQRGAQKHGATVLRGTAALIREGDRIAGVRVDGDVLAADAVIIAGGAWSGRLGETLGLHLPIYPQRGQILHLELPGTETSRWPIVLGFHAHYILTFPRERVVAGATREDDAGYDPRMTAGGVHEALSEALRVAPGLARATLREVRVGLRPASPDGLPVLGQVPGLLNAYVATGHGPSGLQLGPYSGVVAADLLQGQTVSLDLAPFDPGRF